jgi:hypothetical protein
MELTEFAKQFNTDLKAIEIVDLLKPKCWDEIAVKYPEYIIVEDEILQWLGANCPNIFGIINSASKRKRHDINLINGIKASILIGQNDFVGLRSADHSRFTKLYFDSIKLVQAHLDKLFDKHDLIAELREIDLDHINAYKPYNLFGYTGKPRNELTWLYDIALVKQPDSVYLNVAKTVNEEAVRLHELYKNVDEIEFHPKNSSDYHHCACCFRWVRLKPSNPDQIAYHGYTIDRGGYNEIASESCSGASYKPLEMSSEGTFVILERNKKKLEKINEELSLWKDNNSDMGKKYVRSLNNGISSIKSFAELAVKMIEKYQPDDKEHAKKFLVE